MKIDTPQPETIATYRHVFFDCDGVIVDSTNAAIDVYQEIRHSRFPALPLVQSRDDLCLVYAGSLRDSLGQWLTEDESSEFFDLHSKRMMEIYSSQELYDGIIDLLERLAPGTFSIVTSAYSEQVKAILDAKGKFDTSRIFRIAGRELKRPKNMKVTELLRELDLDANEALYVGDLESDLIYSRRVPIDCALVTYGYLPASYFKTLVSKPDYLAGSVSELSELLTNQR